MREVNGQKYQHSTMKVTAQTTGGSFTFSTFAKISYKHRVPKKRSHDAQGRTDGFTFDKEEIEASISMKLSEWMRFRQNLLSVANGLGVLQTQFDTVVTRGNGVNDMKTDTLRGVMAEEDPRESEDNQDPHMVEIPLFVTEIDFADGPSMVYEE